MSLDESIKNGTVDITNMAETVIYLGKAFKGGLGPVGWFMLAIEGLTLAWNTYAQGQKKAREQQEKYLNTLETKARKTKQEHEAAFKAVADYNAEQERVAQKEAQLKYYEQVNESLRTQKKLIEDSIKAELRKQALSEDAAEHAAALKKLELETKLATGAITQEEYEEELLKLDRDKKKAEAEKVVKKKELEVRSAEKTENLMQKRAQTTEERLSKENDFKSLFEYTPEQIELMHAEYKKVADRYNEANEKARDMQSFNYEERASWAKIARESKQERDKMHDILYGEDGSSIYRNSKQYRAEYEAWQARIKTAENEANKAKEELRQAQERLADSRSDLEAAKESSAQEISQADDIYKAQTNKNAAKRAAKKAQKDREEKLDELKKEVTRLEEKDIKARIAAARRKATAAQGSRDFHRQKYYQDRVDIYEDELKNRSRNAVDSIDRMKGVLASGGKRNALTKWAETTGYQMLQGGPQGEAQLKELLAKAEAALESQSKLDDQLFAILLKEIKLREDISSKQKKKLEKMQKRVEANVKNL